LSNSADVSSINSALKSLWKQRHLAAQAPFHSAVEKAETAFQKLQDQR
jgi:hypothetical protein